MSVGQTLGGHQITVALVDAAALGALAADDALLDMPSLNKHIEMLGLLGHKVVVEKESLAKYGHGEAELRPGVQLVDAETILAELTAADAVITY